MKTIKRLATLYIDEMSTPLWQGMTFMHIINVALNKWYDGSPWVVLGGSLVYFFGYPILAQLHRHNDK